MIGKFDPPGKRKPFNQYKYQYNNCKDLLPAPGNRSTAGQLYREEDLATTEETSPNEERKKSGGAKKRGRKERRRDDGW
ncbi:hypothetical protein TNCV_987471 [Trichonephila clavipes]|nr:hypothetical protein TNCV_987471 [Trichonephila clavipes]